MARRPNMTISNRRAKHLASEYFRTLSRHGKAVARLEGVTPTELAKALPGLERNDYLTIADYLSRLTGYDRILSALEEEMAEEEIDEALREQDEIFLLDSREFFGQNRN